MSFDYLILTIETESLLKMLTQKYCILNSLFELTSHSHISTDRQCLICHCADRLTHITQSMKDANVRKPEFTKVFPHRPEKAKSDGIIAHGG